MTEDSYQPLDLNAFLKNSQYLDGEFKESFDDYLGQLLQKAMEVWDDDPALAYEYCREFQHNVPSSILPEIFQLVGRMEAEFEELTAQDFLALAKRVTLEFEEICIHNMLACFHYRNLDIDECADECRKALRNHKNLTHPNYLLALCLSLRGKYKEAVPFFKKVLHSEDYQDSATANLAYIYLRLGKNWKALRLHKKIVDVFASNYRIQYYMALCYARTWRRRKALYYLDRAEALEKNFSGIYLTRGSIYYKQRNYELAFNDLRRAKALGSTQADRFLR